MCICKGARVEFAKEYSNYLAAETHETLAMNTHFRSASSASTFALALFGVGARGLQDYSGLQVDSHRSLRGHLPKRFCCFAKDIKGYFSCKGVLAKERLCNPLALLNVAKAARISHKFFERLICDALWS